MIFSTWSGANVIALSGPQTLVAVDTFGSSVLEGMVGMLERISLGLTQDISRLSKIRLLLRSLLGSRP